MDWVLGAWGRILAGDMPALSIEITRECPLRCPGCYAYGDEHLGGGITLRQVRDFKGDALIQGVLGLVERYRPLHLSIVGGEPLVRFRELGAILPALSARGVHVQLVTSAVRPIPAEWREIRNLTIVVSIDGLAPEHDVRRAPATYDRILTHIAGHRITVHCTVTRQLGQRPGYLREFLKFWSTRPETRKVWMSLYTPQIGEESPEKLTPDVRAQVLADLRALRREFPKLEAPESLIDVYANPPASPDECTFALTTRSVSADLTTRITPCQFGGTPDCTNCGCIASAGLGALARHKVLHVIPVGTLFTGSLRIGRAARRLRGRERDVPAEVAAGI